MNDLVESLLVSLLVIVAYALIYKVWCWVGTSRAFAAGLGAVVVLAAVAR
jgi:hypothetical protein